MTLLCQNQNYHNPINLRNKMKPHVMMRTLTSTSTLWFQRLRVDAWWWMSVNLSHWPSWPVLFCSWSSPPTNIAHCQVEKFGLPDGPTTLVDLFQWPEFNASKLLKEANDASMAVQRLKDILQREIHVFDSYSGMGTGSFTLHIQQRHMVRQQLMLELRNSMQNNDYGTHCLIWCRQWQTA